MLRLCNERCGMPRVLQYLRGSILALLFALLTTAGCAFCDNVSTGIVSGDSVDGPMHYEQPANTWIDNTRMASFLRIVVEQKGRRQLGYSGYDCSPRPVGDCPDCLLCTRKIRGANNGDCKPEGDLFIRAYVGPGSNVQAQTYWRK